MKNIKRTTKKVYANEILQNRRIHKNGKVQLRRGKVNILTSEKSQNQTTEDQKKTDNKKSTHTQKILQKKLKWKKRERQCKSRKIFKRYVYLRKIANL